MPEFSLHEEIRVPDSDVPIIIEFDAETNNLVVDVYDALMVTRHLTDGSQVDIAHPYVIMLMTVFEYEQAESIAMAQTINSQYLNAAMNDAYLAAMCWNNFQVNPKQPGRVAPKIPGALPDNWWDQSKANDKRVGLGTLPLPDINPRSAAEIRVGYLKLWQDKYPDFRGAALRAMKTAVSKMVIDGFMEEKKKTDEAGFRSGDVDRDLDGAAGADYQAGEPEGADPQTLPGDYEVPGRDVEGAG